jgi:hypothetical protein
VRLERGEMGLEIERRSGRRPLGVARLSADVEHDRNLCGFKLP